MPWRELIPAACGCICLAWGSPAPGAFPSSRPANLPEPTRIKQSTSWGYVYHQFRHHAGDYFKGPNVDQGFYEFLVRLPFLKTSVSPSSKPPLVILLHSRSGDFNRHERGLTDHVVLFPDDNTRDIGHTGWFGYHDQAPKPPKPDSVVVPYTQRRLIYYIEFAIRKYNVDPNRIWIRGGSMGGGGALLFALHHPEWVIGAEADKPPIDMRALPMLLPLAQKTFGPIKLDLKVADTDVSVWQYTSVPWLMANRPGCPVWLDVRHGRLDKVVPFEQYLTSLNPPGRSFLQLFEQGVVPGTFVWDMSGHDRGDPMGTWRADFSPLGKGLIRLDLPTFAFSNGSQGHLGVPEKLGQWHARQHPTRNPRGLINDFCRWDPTSIVDLPERLEIALWLSDEGNEWQRCPVESMTFSVSPRGMLGFPVPRQCAFRYAVVPDGPTGRAASDESGVLTINDVPIRRGRDKAVRLRIEHAMPLPVLSIACPSHPTRRPTPATSVVSRWTVANGSPESPMPVDRYRCWISPKPSMTPPDGSDTSETERVFESLAPGSYHVMVQARLVTGQWGPVTIRQVNIDPTAP
ncbi:MAG: hypothetical protein JXQ73_18635 [Phycisphaerae bacterium]|nr:hypothetical protein [Phycisphaerae bacterium]